MSNERKKAAFRDWKTVFFYVVLKPNRYSKATFEVIGVRFIPRWWRRGESNPCPKTLQQDFLRVQPAV